MHRIDNPPIVPEGATFFGTCKYFLRQLMWSCIDAKEDVDQYFDENIEIVQEALAIDESDDIPDINTMNQDEITFLDKFRFILSRIIFGCIDVKENIDEQFEININNIKNMLDAHEVEAHTMHNTDIIHQDQPMGDTMN